MSGLVDLLFVTALAVSLTGGLVCIARMVHLLGPRRD